LDPACLFACLLEDRTMQCRQADAWHVSSRSSTKIATVDLSASGTPRHSRPRLPAFSIALSACLVAVRLVIDWYLVLDGAAHSSRPSSPLPARRQTARYLLIHPIRHLSLSPPLALPCHSPTRLPSLSTRLPPRPIRPTSSPFAWRRIWHPAYDRLTHVPDLTCIPPPCLPPRAPTALAARSAIA
jgi:hypothetical protein